MISRRRFTGIGLAGLAMAVTGDHVVAQIIPPHDPRLKPITVDRLDRIVMVAGDLDRLARFYTAIGFVVEEARPAPLHAQLAQAKSATSRMMRIGNDKIELVAFDPPGAGFPQLVKSTDPWFQHIALIAPDMEAAMTRLHAAEGWTPISRDGPVELPRELLARLGRKTGGLSVFKFRDPEGHALEFASYLGEPPPQWVGTGPGLIGYDHSVIGVTNAASSTAFYRKYFGMTLGGQAQRSSSPEQDRSDDVNGVVVDVVEMMPVRATTPHVEFLAYHGKHAHPQVQIGPRDRAATRLVLASREIVALMLLQDPDGHWIELIPA